VPASLVHYDYGFERCGAVDGSEATLTFQTSYDTRRYGPGTDVEAVFGEDVAVTPLLADPTARALLASPPSFEI
jgi:hypothetical protein